MQATSYGTATANQLAIPKGNPWYTPYDRYRHDVDKAEEPAATRPASTPSTLDMLVTSEYPETVTAAQVIADNLAPLGITVNIRTVDFATWLDEQNTGNFDMLMMGWLGNIDPDDFYYAQHHTDGTSNAQKFSNPEVDRLLDAGRIETDRQRAQGRLRQGGHDHRRRGELHLPLQPVGDPGVDAATVGLRGAPRRRDPVPRPREPERRVRRRSDAHPIAAVPGPAAGCTRWSCWSACSIVVFALVHLVPGDPVRIALGTRYTPEAYDALRAASGLDRPLIEQFFGYVGSALTGDLGVSFRNGDPVTAILLDRLPATVSLACVGIVIALLDRAARRHLLGTARGPGQRRDRARHKPIRRLDARLLDGHPADRAVLHRRSAGCRPRVTGRCSRIPAAGCATSSCPG